ncbi:MAG: CHAT domain-containing protein [Thermoanaerobaculia bacterium]
MSAAVPSSEDDARRAARAALDRGDLKGAQALIDNALTRFGTRDTEAVWALRVLRGEALYGLGDRAAARQALSFDLPQKFRKSETAVRHLILQTYAFPDRSAELGERARALAAVHVPAALADVYVAMIGAQSDVSRAEELAREAIRAARKHSGKTSQAKAMASLAFVLNRREHFAESIQWGEQALVLARSTGLVKTTQQIEANLGWSYLDIGDYETAAELFTRAEATAARMNARSDRVASLIQLGNIREEQRDLVGAERYNAQAVAIAREIGHSQLGLALANLARIAIETGRIADARRLNAEAIREKRNEREAQLRSRILEARILVAEGKHDAARKVLNDVIAETKRSMTRAEAAGELAQIHVRTNRRDLAETEFRRAIAAAEERDEVKDPDLRFSLFNPIAEIFGQYVDFLARGNRVEDALAVTETRRAQLLEEGLSLPSKLDARAVARQNDATILCYRLGRERSYLWVVTQDKVALHVLPPDSVVEKAAEEYRSQLLTPRGSMQWSGARGEALYQMLVQPAAPAIAKGSRVIVVADGKLHALNFETLVVPTPRRYWIEDVVLMNASSLRLLARPARKRAATPAMLVVGNAPSPDPSFTALPYAGAEIRAIEKRFDRRMVLEGRKATPAAYKAASPEKFDYVHFVAHGVATRKRPLDSAVILAPDASSRYKLLARDVIARPLTAKLVTISSCHGVGTRTYAGEGVVGLAWAFLRAGADQVIAALWEVNDAATPQLMDRMYAGIRAGKDPAVALRDAKLQLVRGTGAHRRPQYWAPFVLYAGT